ETAVGGAEFGNRFRWAHVPVVVVLALVVVGFVLPVAWRRARTGFLPDLAWVDEHRQPDDRERRSLVALPRRFALFTFPYWLVLAIENVVVAVVFRAAADALVGLFFGVLLTWMATAAACYLMAERRLRPLFVSAFENEPPPRLGTASIRARLLVAWSLGSGIPLLFGAATPAAVGPPGRVTRAAGVRGGGGP